MSDPTEPIPTVDAKKALADQGEPNVPTKTVPPPPPGQLVDKRGTAFDDALHSRDRYGNPMMRADGGWALKRGNGARKAQGKPVVGAAAAYVSVAPKTEAAAAAGGAAAAADAPMGAAAAPPSRGAAGDVVDALPADTAPLLTEEDYNATAQGLTNGGFSLMRLLFGPAWEPDAAERDTWVGALRRLWHHYQLPRVGPIVEVLILLPVTFAKRRDDARTKQGLAKVKAWLGVKPKPDDGAAPATGDAKAA